MAHLFWYLTGAAHTWGLFPFVRALLVCVFIYQLDLLAIVIRWLARKAGLIASDSALEPRLRHSALVLLPTLLRGRDELEGMKCALRSVVRNRYPGPLVVVACIDGRNDRPRVFEELEAWAAREPVPANARLCVVGTGARAGKAMAMDHGVEHVKALVDEGSLPAFPTVFFNMDADSVLGPRALERMVFKLTRARWLTRTPRLIVTSNVLVSPDQALRGIGSLFSSRHWLATLVGREYLTAISLGRTNTGLIPVTEASGALYCTWSDVYLPAPRFARFLQSLRWVDWLKWWVGCAPPRFSDFRGPPLVEAMTGPGDDTWMTWFASSARWVGGRLTFDFPRTPLHAFAYMLSGWVSRALAFDSLAQVYTKTPTTVRGLFQQRLRWNSSRMQDLKRWGPALMYSWQIGGPVFASSCVAIFFNGLFVSSALLIVLRCHLTTALGVALLAEAGYGALRLTDTVVALVVSECGLSHWVFALSLPLGGIYHVYFNTLTWIVGSFRDVFGFGQPTTFVPESTARVSGLSRFALAYRVRRAFLLACRALIHGDVPLGAFWLGWNETRWTPNGFDGWTTGTRPPPVYWPERKPKRAAHALGSSNADA
jgi:hypothetical protein